MSIQFVGRTTARSLAAVTTYNVSLTGLTDGIASAPREKDIVVVTYCWSSATNDTVNLPSGNNSSTYQSLIADTYSNDGRDTNGRAAYQIMGSTPDTSVDVPSLSSTTNGSCCAILVFRSVDPITPIDVTVQSASGIDSNLANPPSITPSSPGAWIITGYMGTGDATPVQWTAPTDVTGWYTINSQATAGSFSSKVAMGYKSDWTSGAFDPAAPTGGESGAADSFIAYSAVLRPNPMVFPKIALLVKN